MIEIKAVQLRGSEEFVPLVKSWLDVVFEGDEIDSLELIGRIMQGECQLWAAVRDGRELLGIGVTTLQRRGLYVEAVVGRSLPLWEKEALRVIHEYALANNTPKLLADVKRVGMQRRLQKMGFRTVGVRMQFSREC
jgi:hypothetical protein